MFSSAWHRISDGQAGREQLRVGALGGLRGPQPGVPDHAVEGEQAADPGQAQLLADDGEDEVGVGLGQVEDLLDRLARPDAEQPARADRDLPLDGLEADRPRRRPTGSGTR